MHTEVITEVITVSSMGFAPAEQWPSSYGRTAGLIAVTSHSEIT